jgi:hypothetical protein
MTSGRKSWTQRSASALVDTTPTTVMPSCSSRRRAASAKSALSSTITQRTVYLAEPCCQLGSPRHWCAFLLAVKTAVNDVSAHSECLSPGYLQVAGRADSRPRGATDWPGRIRGFVDTLHGLTDIAGNPLRFTPTADCAAPGPPNPPIIRTHHDLTPISMTDVAVLRAAFSASRRQPGISPCWCSMSG